MSVQEERDFLIQGAALQDSLLQSYRSLHVTIQSILLAVGVGLVVIPLTLDRYPPRSLSSVIAAVILIAIWLLHLYSNCKLKEIVLQRGEDVNYWHGKIIIIEQQLPAPSRHFTAFKVHQQARRKDLAYLERTYLSQNALSNDDVLALIGKVLGHTRRVIDQQIFFWIGTVWWTLLAVTVLSLILGFIGWTPPAIFSPAVQKPVP